jgi:hypothetical protein
MMKQTIKRFVVLGALWVAATGCVSHRIGPALDMGEFPEIRFLAENQARPVRCAPNAKREGVLSQEDWAIIVRMISRLPELSDNDREICFVQCEGDPTVAVRVQLGWGGGYLIQFVKIGKGEWRIASLCMYNV